MVINAVEIRVMVVDSSDVGQSEWVVVFLGQDWSKDHILLRKW